MLAAFLPLLAAAAAEPSTSVPAYPAAAVLEAFGAGCARVASLDDTRKDLQAQGWETYIPVKGTPIGDLLAFGMEAGGKMVAEAGGSMAPSTVLRKTVEEEDLQIILSGVTMSGTTVQGCRLYDVGETRRITPAEAEAWIGRAPDKVTDVPQISVATWEPGKAEDHSSFELYFVPEGSPAIALLKFNGLAMKADHVGAAE
jgi:hypothetical protein